ncbi:hypothetical protein DPMN_139248 [Dreissena polymorpha]|uniref:Uncharacterized protein n=1 Tax=Dreissena polymorpha TaxID=45954 RepID=A0A9D4G5D1_DREPO|nr:hypothetical protein DPMN_139248 [Dreissena polymorpha]
MRLPDILRRCKTVSKTCKALEGDSQTVCDDAKTVWVPAGNSQTVCDGARQSPRPAGTYRRLPNSLRRCQDRLDT